ncbi:MAG TPA: hypothetical protein VJ600_02915 [Holophagaceae bacterium]|nr:hypothetical protein [Holophagaceae bacterium]
MNRAFASLALIPALSVSLVAAAPKVDPQTFAGLAIRNIGPAVMGGRVSALDGFVENGRITLFLGAASGGVWKSQNGGTSFKPLFDKQIQSIGAVRVDPSDHRTLWVGTGESWTRNSVSVGDGIYKSTDGGDTWTNMGLKDSEHIAQVLVDPRDSKVVYAAALGHLWSSGGERGLYRSADGGKTWLRVLATNDDAGCASVAMDPKNPDVLYAAMWQFRRRAWAFESGGPGGGLYKSTDGGRSWIRLDGDAKRGLPAGEVGRCAFAVAPSDPRIVYCVVEAKEGGLYRSEDGGGSWKRVNRGAEMLSRPFYFSTLTVDPKNPDRVYKPGFNLSLSEDGGRTFSTIASAAHGDFHAVWVDPERPEHVYMGSDGGFYESQDRGATVVFQQNLPIAQYYHVSLDDQVPYNTYGGLQDNSSWRGPSRTGGAIQNRHWRTFPNGDGFWAQPDPSDPDYAYTESQGGEIVRTNMRTGETRAIKPQEQAGEAKYRWNWNSPIVLSPNHKGAIYMGCQYLFRSEDHGLTWQKLSPDLTTNDPKKQQQEQSGGVTTDNSAAENHCTIYAVAESPLDKDLIWVGTDDGRLQVTRDGGKSWTDTVANVPGLPEHTWVSWIEPSPYAAGTAFATFDGHTTGDLRTYVYRTTDYGRTWTPLATPQLEGFAHVVRQDPVNRELLYLGTEFGLFLSVDGGAAWSAFRPENFPKVAVRDIAIHPRDKDLVLATHGRGLWIVDDLTPLRALGKEAMARPSAFLPVRPSERSVLQDFGWVDGDAQFNGQGPSYGAAFAYHQQKRHIFGDLKFEILDAQGQVLGTLPGDPRRGIQRLFWNMRLKAPRVPVGASPVFVASGPRVLEGAYTIRMTDGPSVQKTELRIVPDPLSVNTAEDRRAQFDLAMDLFRMIDGMAYTTERLVALRDGARGAQAKDPALKARLEAFAAALETLRAEYVPVKEGAGITGEEKHREHLVSLYQTVAGFDGRPAPAAFARRDALKKDIGATDLAVAQLVAKDLGPLNAALKAEGAAPIQDLTWKDWDARTATGPGAGKGSPEELAWSLTARYF